MYIYGTIPTALVIPGFGEDESLIIHMYLVNKHFSNSSQSNTNGKSIGRPEKNVKDNLMCKLPQVVKDSVNAPIMNPIMSK